MLCDDHGAREEAGGLLVWPQVRLYHSLLSSHLLSSLRAPGDLFYFIFPKINTG